MHISFHGDIPVHSLRTINWLWLFNNPFGSGNITLFYLINIKLVFNTVILVSNNHFLPYTLTAWLTFLAFSQVLMSKLTQRHTTEMGISVHKLLVSYFYCTGYVLICTPSRVRPSIRYIFKKHYDLLPCGFLHSPWQNMTAFQWQELLVWQLQNTAQEWKLCQWFPANKRFSCKKIIF